MGEDHYGCREETEQVMVHEGRRREREKESKLVTVTVCLLKARYLVSLFGVKR